MGWGKSPTYRFYPEIELMVNKLARMSAKTCYSMWQIPSYQRYSNPR
jgi:hypothetical protein